VRTDTIVAAVILTDVVRTANIAVVIRELGCLICGVAKPHVVPTTVVTISRDRRVATTMEIVLAVLRDKNYIRIENHNRRDTLRRSTTKFSSDLTQAILFLYKRLHFIRPYFSLDVEFRPWPLLLPM